MGNPLPNIRYLIKIKVGEAKAIPFTPKAEKVEELNVLPRSKEREKEKAKASPRKASTQERENFLSWYASFARKKATSRRGVADTKRFKQHKRITISSKENQDLKCTA